MHHLVVISCLLAIVCSQQQQSPQQTTGLSQEIYDSTFKPIVDDVNATCANLANIWNSSELNIVFENQDYYLISYLLANLAGVCSYDMDYVKQTWVKNISSSQSSSQKRYDEQYGYESQPPYTQPPETQPPETQPPYTQPPETQPPYTQPPETQPPYTQPPETQPPYTQPYNAYGDYSDRSYQKRSSRGGNRYDNDRHDRRSCGGRWCRRRCDWSYRNCARDNRDARGCKATWDCSCFCGRPDNVRYPESNDASAYAGYMNALSAYHAGATAYSAQPSASYVPGRYSPPGYS